MKKNVLIALVFSIVSLGASAQETSPDAKFIDQMSEHHRMGMEMMKIADKKAQTPEVKKMTTKMEKNQKKEVEQMQKWRGEYFSSAPKAEPMAHKMDMSHLEQAQGKEFDKMYLEMMSKHHEDGVKMVNDYQAQLKNSQVKTFAEKTAKNQKEEIKKMSQMKSDIERK
ncbi:MAG: DUF305 domain-containing protein [Pseudobdellovibrionaceae bacterium]